MINEGADYRNVAAPSPAFAIYLFTIARLGGWNKQVTPDHRAWPR